MKLNNKDLYTDDLKSSNWIGIIEDNEDPLFKGRCKIRVLGKFDKRINSEDQTSDFIIPTDKLPWARPSNNIIGGSNTGSGNFDIPKLKSVVNVTFDNGNMYSPIYHNNVYYSDEVRGEIENSYKNSHIIIYDTAFGLIVDENGEISNEREDEHIKVFFTEEKGFMIDYSTTEGSTTVNIKPDNSVEVLNPNGDSILMLNDGNITFKHSAKFIIESDDNTEISCKDAIINCDNANINASEETHINSPKIKLGKQAAESVIKGDTFKRLFDSHVHPTGIGPTLPPTPPSINNTYLSTRNTTD